MEKPFPVSVDNWNARMSLASDRNRTKLGSAEMDNENDAIAAVLAGYGEALNRSDTEAAMRLYAPDAVFMPQNSPSSIGIEAIRAAYDAIFKAITLQVTFEVAEIRAIAPDWAFARTNSAGRVSIHATGGGRAEA